VVAADARELWGLERERRGAKNTRNKILDDVLFGWEANEDRPEYEEKGDISRIRLAGQEQILAARIGDLL